MFGRLFFWIQWIEYWLSPGYSVMIDIIRSMSMDNWFIGIVREQVSMANKCFDQLIPHNRHSEKVLWGLLSSFANYLCVKNLSNCAKTYSQNLYLSSCVKNYAQKLYFSIELSIGSCLESQVNGNEHKLRVGKSMLEINIKDEEFSGLRLKLEELLRFGWKFNLFSCWLCQERAYSTTQKQKLQKKRRIQFVLILF